MILQTFPLELIPWIIFSSIVALIAAISGSIVYITSKNIFLRLKAKQFTIGQRMFLCEKSNFVMSLGQERWRYNGDSIWTVDCPICKNWHPVKLLGGFH